MSDVCAERLTPVSWGLARSGLTPGTSWGIMDRKVLYVLFKAM